jgi:hypothetical protein
MLPFVQDTYVIEQLHGCLIEKVSMHEVYSMRIDL